MKTEKPVRDAAERSRRTLLSGADRRGARRVAILVAAAVAGGSLLFLSGSRMPAMSAQTVAGALGGPAVARVGLPAATTPAPTISSGGLSSGPAGGATSGGPVSSAQLTADLIQAGDLDDYTALGSAANADGRLCGITLATLSPAVAQGYVMQVDADFVAIGATQPTLRVSIAGFVDARRAAAFMQEVLTHSANHAIAGSSALLLDNLPVGQACALAQSGDLVVAVMVNGADSQSAAATAQQALAAQLARLKDPTAPHAAPSATITTAASPAASGSPNSSPTPSATPLPDSNSDEDPPQPDLF